jgi:glycosyltransferase involved in cell wall biosynthesis
MKKQNKYNPLISILMPVYNAGDFLVEAIKSIRNQTLKDWELIVIDDGSTDKSNEILKKYADKDVRIEIFKFKKNKGLAFALNYGLNKVRGKYLARMDADDISYPKRLETQLRYLIRNPKVVAVGSQVKLINEKGSFIGYKKFPTDPKKIYQMMETMMAIQHPTLFTYTKIIKKCPYANHTTAEDVSMFFKLLQYGDFLNTKEVLFKYRVRKNSNSLKNPKKTFYLTLKSRIKAVVDWGYKPTVKGVLINFIQYIIITFLPTHWILRLYEFLRFRNKTNILKKQFVSRKYSVRIASIVE